MHFQKTTLQHDATNGVFKVKSQSGKVHTVVHNHHAPVKARYHIPYKHFFVIIILLQGTFQ